MAKTIDFLNDEYGAVTIEFTALFPFFLFLLIFFVDASMIYLTHSEMTNAARDIVRRMSTDQFTTLTQVEDYAETKLLLGSREYEIQVDFGAEQMVVISVPMGEAAIFGIFFQPILGNTLAVVSRQRREPLA
ncbi:MAG: pilus assembly protein [Paracoccaceae bacterium]|nr:pilus assembly protein [Paracoccaceae bacterium]